MRKGFNGLTALAQHQLSQDPLSGHLFVFCNRQRDRIKVLFWDGSGLWVCAKRLEKGRFSWPDGMDDKGHISIQQLAWLIDGLALKSTAFKEWFRR